MTSLVLETLKATPERKPDRIYQEITMLEVVYVQFDRVRRY